MGPMRALIISDIHGNADALRAVIESARGWDYLWVMGDLVDYGPEPHIVVDEVRGLSPDIIVMGNHDNAVAYGVDCGCAPELHDLSMYTRIHISYRLLEANQIEWLRNLPKVHAGSCGPLKIYAVHGAPRNPLYGYLKPGLPERELLLMLTPSPIALNPKPVEANIVITGHTHIPMDLKVGTLRILNPGSVGQPRDGDPRAAYMVLDLESGEASVFKVRYDIEAVVAKLRALRLEEGHLRRLEYLLRNGKVG